MSFTVPANNAVVVPIGNKLTVTFNEEMDPATITTATFLLKQGITPVSGTVTYAGLSAIFTPANNLAANTLYTATITTGAEDLAGNTLAINYVWSFTTGAAVDITAPKVTFTVPANNSVGVPIGNKLTATFSEAMDPATINTATFTLYGGPAVAGTVIYSGVTAVFTPLSNLAPNTSYMATITTRAKDLAGNPLTIDYVWTFDTGSATDITAPTVTLTVPVNAAIGVLANAKITATFSEAMAPLTINTTTFTLSQLGLPVSGAVTYAGITAVFTPKGSLGLASPYTATITTGATDLAGNPLTINYVWNFNTGGAADITAPTVTLTAPVDTATGVVLSKKIKATFDEAMNPLTINTTTFTLTEGVTPVSGTVSYVGLVATFTPANNLAANTLYTATITTEAEDLAGNTVVVPALGGLPNPWTFTTVAVLPLGPLPIDLGTAGNFVLLSKSGITTTGVTTITGDIGVSPIDSTAITGFGLAMDGSNQFSTSVGGPGSVIGKVYAAYYAVPTPANLTTAISDMETAYVDAAGQALPDFTELGAGNISGMTLVPGLYKWGTGVLIDNTGVTISGGANDVWIFQISDDLTVNNAAIVTLSGGAQAKNIFWQVEGGVGVTLGTTSQFKGNILAQKGIVINTGAMLTGRALVQTNITLNANIITGP